MSETRSIGATVPATAQVRAAIARAAEATGVDFAYLLGQARLESSLDPNARAATSSAAGLYQFTNGTWLATLGRHGAEHGLDWAEAAIARGDPGARVDLLALRYDPQVAALMAAELASDNRAALRERLGREPDSAELYMAHFLGADGARRFLAALDTDPLQSAAAILPKAAAANRAIFYDEGGAARSLGGVMDLMRGRLSLAMRGAQGGAAEQWAGMVPPGGATPSGSAPLPPPPRASMAQTLAATFGGAGAAVPDHVRSAYARLQALGL